MLLDGAAEAYRLVDSIDQTLGVHLAELVELANLSAMIGNLLATGIVRSSGGVFERAGAHKYQDLRGTAAGACNIEVKVALETNRPKGHLPKAGHYLTARYVLVQEDGTFQRSIRGVVPYIWEIRLGHLELSDFSVSNTDGDSGKTAVVSTQGMRKLRLLYFDEHYCPFANVRRYLAEYGS